MGGIYYKIAGMPSRGRERLPNDANQWSDDPRYIVDLIKRVVTVSVESVKVVAGLPALG
jgi:predicted helicase